MEKILFAEEQRMNQWWMWLLMSLLCLSVITPFAIGIYKQTVLGVPFGDQPMSTGGLVATGLFSLLITAGTMIMVLGSRLKTKITQEALYVCYPPLVRKWKKISPDEIERFEIRTYKAKREFGGRGIRRRMKSGRAYIVSGNIGLQLYFKNGKKFLIGTQKKQAIEYAMRKLMEGES